MTKISDAVDYQYKLYTDGSYSPKSKCGGMAYVVTKYNRKVRNFSFSVENCTSQRAELYAIISGLKYCDSRNISPLLVTDSQYAIKVIKNGAKWREKNWRLSSGKKAKNIDLIKIILDLCQRVKFDTEHIRSHTGSIHIDAQFNDMVDKMAVSARSEL